MITREENDDIELPCPPVAQETEEMLEEFSPLVVRDFRQFKEDFLRWLLTEGRDTYRREGYSETTVKTTHYKVDETYRWLWERDGEFTKELSPEDATDLIDFLMRKTPHPDQYVYTFEKCIRRLFKYLREELNRPIDEWEHEIPVEPNRHSSTKDRFYPAEMNRLYEAALSIYSVKSYYTKSMTSEERDQIKRVLAQRFGKPKGDIGPDDFQRANSWKIPSLVAVTADTGLRPIEVGRTKVDWMNLENQKMLVPKDESTKNEDNWECGLSKKSVNALRHWLKERQSYELYRGRDELWLTSRGKPYGSGTLNDVLSKLIDEAEIDEQGRNLSWYSFRHGVASMWAEEKGIYKARNQLRHKDIETTLRYTRNSGSALSNSAEGMW